MRKVFGLLLILSTLLAINVGVLAASSAASTALPPRPTVVPTPKPTSTPSPAPAPTLTPAPVHAQEIGAHILLSAGSAYEGMTTMVQWQGGDGVWHDVEGWRGQVETGQVRWWVAERDLGTGPFRWVIGDRGEKTLAVSDPFSLPAERDQIRTVTATALANQ